VRDAQGLAARTAYAWVQLGDGRMAVIAQERGRAVLLAEAVSLQASLARLSVERRDGLRRAYESAATWVAGLAEPRLSDTSRAVPGFDPRQEAQEALDAAISAIRAVPGHESFLCRLTDDEVFAQVMARASEQPLVYLVPGTVGGVTLIARGGGSVQIIDLPQLTESALAELVATYFDAYNALRKRRVSLRVWRGVLEELTRRLGDVVGRPSSRPSTHQPSSTSP